MFTETKLSSLWYAIIVIYKELDSTNFSSYFFYIWRAPLIKQKLYNIRQNSVKVFLHNSQLLLINVDEFLTK